MPNLPLIDARFNALKNKGYTGNLNDKLLQWLRANGATSKDLNDAWSQFFVAQGQPASRKRADQAYAWLGGLAGMTTSKSINDRWFYFWNHFSTYFP